MSEQSIHHEPNICIFVSQLVVFRGYRKVKCPTTT